MEKKTLPPKLENQKLILKKHTLDLAYVMYEEIDRDRERLRRFLPWVDHIKSADNEIWYINECIKDWEESRMFDYGIYTKEGEYAGNISIHHIQWNKDCCEFGYWLVGRHEGKGLISSAVQLIEAELFELGFNRVEIRCDPANDKSAAVPKRCGYTFEGTLRQEAMMYEKYRDTSVYSKIKADLKR